MGNLVIYVGGVSASGKTTSTCNFGNTHCISVIELDKFHDRTVKKGIAKYSAEAITRGVVFRYAHKLLQARTHCIIEGGWMNPNKANDLTLFPGFRPIYCGYPHAIAEERLKDIRIKAKHWLTRLNDNEALRWIAKQIDGSRWYESECQKYGFTFVDFTDFQKGNKALVEHLEALLEQNVG